MSAFQDEYKKGITMDTALERREKDMLVRTRRNRRQKLREKRVPQSSSIITNDTDMSDHDFVKSLFAKIDVSNLFGDYPEDTVAMLHKIFAFNKGDTIEELFVDFLFPTDESLNFINQLVHLFNRPVTEGNREMMMQLCWILLVIGHHDRTDRFLNRMIVARYLPVALNHLAQTDDHRINSMILNTLSNACNDCDTTRDYLLNNGVAVGVEAYVFKVMKQPESPLKTILKLEFVNYARSCFKWAATNTLKKYTERIWRVARSVEVTINPLEQMQHVELEIYIGVMLCYSEICKNRDMRRVFTKYENLVPHLMNIIQSQFAEPIVLFRILEWLGHLCEDDQLKLIFLESNILDVSISLLGKFRDPDFLVQTLYLIYQFAFNFAAVRYLLSSPFLDVVGLIFRNVKNADVQTQLFVLLVTIVVMVRDFSENAYEKNNLFTVLLEKNILLMLADALKSTNMRFVVNPAIVCIKALLDWNCQVVREKIMNTSILDTFHDLEYNKVGFDSSKIEKILSQYFDIGEDQVIEMEMNNFDF